MSKRSRSALIQKLERRAQELRDMGPQKDPKDEAARKLAILRLSRTALRARAIKRLRAAHEHSS